MSETIHTNEIKFTMSWENYDRGCNELGEEIEDLLSEIGLPPEFNKPRGERSIIGLDQQEIWFSKLEETFKKLAPYVDSGSFIEFWGGEDWHWKYIFENCTMREVKGRVVYDE